MSREADERSSSIWSEHPTETNGTASVSPAVNGVRLEQLGQSSELGKLGQMGQHGQRRARAGTLPSRLPSRLDTSIREPPEPHLGSLALISPDGNDVLSDNFPPLLSRAAVGQPTESMQGSINSGARTPGVSYSRSHETRDVASGILGAGAYPHEFSTGSRMDRVSPPRNVSPLPAIQEPVHGDENVVDSQPIPSPTQPFQAGHKAQFLAKPQTRSRSGSLNSLAQPLAPFNPFNTSIWSPPTHQPGPLSSGLAGTLGSAGSVGSTTSIASNGSSEEKSDGSPFSEYAKPPQARLRAYTLDTTGVGQMNDWASPRVPYSSQRPRAQTLLGGPPMLGRFAPGTLTESAMQEIELSAAPTPALWVSNVPVSATPYSLHALFAPFGRVEVARIVGSRHGAYVAFASTAHAIEAQATLNGAELYAGNGASPVAFAQISYGQPPHQFPLSGMVAGSQMAPQYGTAQVNQRALPQVLSRRGYGRASTPPSSRALNDVVQSPSTSGSGITSIGAPISVAYVLQTLNASSTEIAEGIAHLQRAAKTEFVASIRPLAELLAVDPGPGDKTYSAAVLRDLRRRLESMPMTDVEEVALDMQRELPALASDYIGNTVVQLVFERSGTEIRDMMLRRLLPVFAATGTHKNGTWAVQKMIDLSRGARQYALIESTIRPHLVPLLLDQFGNYVVQGCLKFGTPYSDFVYAGIAASLSRIAPNRFGARAVRAVLESEHTTPQQQRLVATAIVQQITQLASNQNGSLLVAWLLDNFERTDPETHSRTHAIVAAQLVPQHLVEMCTSKLGASIILKLASSSSAPRVFDSLLEPLSDRVPPLLDEVLSDETGQGATFVYRLLMTVLAPNSMERQVAVNKVRMCLLRPGARAPNHKRLLEEVGLSMLHPETGSHSSDGSPQATPAAGISTSDPIDLGSAGSDPTVENGYAMPQVARVPLHHAVP